MSIFRLPDLGEDLQEAEIREWHVKVGDIVAVDQPLLAVETAKAVVEVQSPQAGVIRKLYGQAGDTMAVGKPLVEFDSADATVLPRKAEVAGTAKSPDPMARGTGADLTITPTGPDGTVTAADARRVHQSLAEMGPLEKLHGPRKVMAQAMSRSRDQVMPASITDDAVLSAWPTGPGAPRPDLSVRLIRALVAGVRAEPALNAWYDGEEFGRRLIEKIHVGIGVDTAEGLFVAVLQDVGSRSAESLRLGLEATKRAVRDRTIPAEELRGYTITLSNFGRFGGRYATPVIVPPTVAIVAAGALREGVVAIDGKPAVARVLPLSVTFDHRCVTGGEAARFLAAMIGDLQKAE